MGRDGKLGANSSYSLRRASLYCISSRCSLDIVRPESEQEERRENQAGANKSGEINKTFPEGGFLFILATSFHPRTNFSC